MFHRDQEYGFCSECCGAACELIEHSKNVQLDISKTSPTDPRWGVIPGRSAIGICNWQKPKWNELVDNKAAFNEFALNWTDNLHYVRMIRQIPTEQTLFA
eukprot:3587336-Karenia_brevis.AAC.1